MTVPAGAWLVAKHLLQQQRIPVGEQPWLLGENSGMENSRITILLPPNNALLSMVGHYHSIGYVKCCATCQHNVVVRAPVIVDELRFERLPPSLYATRLNALPSVFLIELDE